MRFTSPLICDPLHQPCLSIATASSCVAWSKRGKLPFPVVDENHQAKAMRDTRYEYVVFDTPGSIDDQGLMELADGCDLMIVPAVPESSATDGLLYTLRRIQRGKGEFGVLLNRSGTTGPKKRPNCARQLPKQEREYLPLKSPTWWRSTKPAPRASLSMTWMIDARPGPGRPSRR